MMTIHLSRVEGSFADESWEFVVDSAIPRTDLIVSSVRLYKVSHLITGIKFWNRGAATSEQVIYVATKDALAITARLFGVSLVEFSNGVAFTLREMFLAGEYPLPAPK